MFPKCNLLRSVNNFEIFPSEVDIILYGQNEDAYLLYSANFWIRILPFIKMLWALTFKTICFQHSQILQTLPFFKIIGLEPKIRNGNIGALA